MDSQTIKSQITTSCKPVSQQMCLSSQSILVSCQNPKLSPHQTVPTSSSPCCCICLLLCLKGPLSPSLPDHLLPFQRHILMFLRKGGILQLMSEGNCWLLGRQFYCMGISEIRLTQEVSVYLIIISVKLSALVAPQAVELSLKVYP